MKKKIITIIICNYNNEKYIKNFLYSVINQKKNKIPYNVIFIDDNSKDNSLYIAKKILKKFRNSTIVKNNLNLGLTKSCNKAIKLCKTNYFIRVDSDDYISNYFIHFFEKFAKNNKYELITSNRIDFKKDKSIRKKILKKNFDIFKLVSCGVALKTNKVKKIGMYKNLLWEEYDLYVRYLNPEKRNIKIIEKNLYYYRRHQKSMSYKKKWIKKAWHQIISKYGRKKLLRFGQIPIKL